MSSKQINDLDVYSLGAIFSYLYDRDFLRMASLLNTENQRVIFHNAKLMQNVTLGSEFTAQRSYLTSGIERETEIERNLWPKCEQDAVNTHRLIRGRDCASLTALSKHIARWKKVYFGHEHSLCRGKNEFFRLKGKYLSHLKFWYRDLELSSILVTCVNLTHLEVVTLRHSEVLLDSEVKLEKLTDLRVPLMSAKFLHHFKVPNLTKLKLLDSEDFDFVEESDGIAFRKFVISLRKLEYLSTVDGPYTDLVTSIFYSELLAVNLSDRLKVIHVDCSTLLMRDFFYQRPDITLTVDRIDIGIEIIWLAYLNKLVVKYLYYFGGYGQRINKHVEYLRIEEVIHHTLNEFVTRFIKLKELVLCCNHRVISLFNIKFLPITTLCKKCLGTIALHVEDEPSNVPLMYDALCKFYLRHKDFIFDVYIDDEGWANNELTRMVQQGINESLLDVVLHINHNEFRETGLRLFH